MTSAATSPDRQEAEIATKRRDHKMPFDLSSLSTNQRLWFVRKRNLLAPTLRQKPWQVLVVVGHTCSLNALFQASRACVQERRLLLSASKVQARSETQSDGCLKTLKLLHSEESIVLVFDLPEVFNNHICNVRPVFMSFEAH